MYNIATEVSLRVAADWVAGGGRDTVSELFPGCSKMHILFFLLLPDGKDALPLAFLLSSCGQQWHCFQGNIVAKVELIESKGKRVDDGCAGRGTTQTKGCWELAEEIVKGWLSQNANWS